MSENIDKAIGEIIDPHHEHRKGEFADIEYVEDRNRTRDILTRLVADETAELRQERDRLAKEALLALAGLANERAALCQQNERLREAASIGLGYIADELDEINERIGPGHSCGGPDSNCDCDCMARASVSNDYHKARVALAAKESA